MPDVWLYAVVAILWGFHLHLVDVFIAVNMTWAELREFWLSANVGLSYFASNVVIAVGFAVLAFICTVRSLSASGNRVDACIAIATLIFSLGFGYRLYFLRTHHLDSSWYAEAVSTESFESYSVHLGLVTSEPGSSPAEITLDTCDQVRLALPEGHRATEIAVVTEMRGQFSGTVRMEVSDFALYDDLCSFAFSFMREARDAGCLASRCGEP